MLHKAFDLCLQFVNSSPTGVKLQAAAIQRLSKFQKGFVLLCVHRETFAFDNRT